MAAEEAEAKVFLESLLGKTLHVTILDGRLFTGAFKCTDNESNVILANSFEYRMPSAAVEKQAIEQAKASGTTSRANLTSRFVGLIVVPGQQIVKIEVEERRMPNNPLAPLSIRTRP